MLTNPGCLPFDHMTFETEKMSLDGYAMYRKVERKLNNEEDPEKQDGQPDNSKKVDEESKVSDTTKDEKLELKPQSVPNSDSKSLESQEIEMHEIESTDIEAPQESEKPEVTRKLLDIFRNHCPK